MSFNIEKPGNTEFYNNGIEQNNKFKFEKTQIGSIFLQDDGDGKVSVGDFNRTTQKFSRFIQQYIDTAAVWTQNIYNKIVEYLKTNQEEIREDSINETISEFKTKASDESQIESVTKENEWTVTKFKDGTFMKENPSEKSVRYYDAKGRWIAGTDISGINYLNTYLDGNKNGYAYLSQEAGSSTISYYDKNDNKVMDDDGEEKKHYFTDNNGILSKIEIRDSQTDKLKTVGLADSNGDIIIIREYKEEKGRIYYEEYDTRTNETKKVYVEENSPVKTEPTPAKPAKADPTDNTPARPTTLQRIRSRRNPN